MPRQRHDPSKNLVGFMVGEVSYAVRIELVREIVNPLMVVALPHAPPSVRGVADYREHVIPVVDLRERFGLEELPRTRRNKWIVVDVARVGQHTSRSGGRFVALVVDLVTEVFGTGKQEIKPAPPLGAGDHVRGIDGVTTHGDKLVFILDVRAFGALADAALSVMDDSIAPPPQDRP